MQLFTRVFNLVLPFKIKLSIICIFSRFILDISAVRFWEIYMICCFSVTGTGHCHKYIIINVTMTKIRTKYLFSYHIDHKEKVMNQINFHHIIIHVQHYQPNPITIHQSFLFMWSWLIINQESWLSIDSIRNAGSSWLQQLIWLPHQNNESRRYNLHNR